MVGHRGSPEREPENTLRSFERAIGEGANALELDLCVTADEEVVLWHDESPFEMRARFRQLGLEPIVRFRPRVPSDARFLRPVSELTLRELRAHFGYADGVSGRVAGSEIPTLDEFVVWASREERLGLVFLDVKVPAAREDLLGVLVRRVDALLRQHAAPFRVIYESASADAIRSLVRLAPEHAHALDIEPPGGLVTDWESCSAVRAAVHHGLRVATPQRPRGITLFPFATHRRIVTRDLERLRRHNESSPGAPVEGICSFTINDADEMRELVELGVWAIQSDRPALLRDVASSGGR
ncbi:MAG TPA: glycerophosphodiester phosphodiesterase family protein [Polyangiaceae bacterium]